MFSGTVKWFNMKRGYGFIIPDEGGQDVFVHISALHKAGLRHLEENRRIRYVLAHSNGKIVAENLVLIEDETPPNDGTEADREMLFA
jgi:CspA family cold shock protein